ncbi:protein translocase subunit secE/sec61 gamma [Archaeoglobus sulfaticallidus PM70-1]|uniref:Protein translocase subunit SecE n=1 Tax=Archaeoglobus sulfaticallidus PM70-1 TaxID=387631 RepID=N0BL72_9EURY|nr:protein translocase SEC61 complex subunit gamma [Archaeoglobus sulfaticallidus]AGK61291.1 protein translocase subunit secE/sec61 gamma [Archaeoglobus sulfaticallidus PM70-1]
MIEKDFQKKLHDYYNLLKMTRKPDREEFITTTKVALAVMFVVGIIGFGIYLILELINKLV